jgi:hypothetical protein
MKEVLKQRILALNPLKPYVWQLRLSAEEYLQLKDFVQVIPTDINKEYAVLAIAYIAEWYKREYCGNVSNPLESLSAESLWKVSGFNTETYLYRTKDTRRHLESIFMLGGLPMHFIQQRNDRRLLKALCRLFKGDKATLEDDANIGRGQAIAFQTSIKNRASIYAFMEALLLNNESAVYAEDDLKAKDSSVNQFIAIVKSAYEEVMHDKFRLEWIVEYDVASIYMRRMLRLHLRPEEMGGYHQYLRFDRANTWHIPDIMTQRQLHVSIRFKKDREVVGDDNTRRTLFTFENTGQEDTGFEASGAFPWAILRSIPTDEFDCIDIVVTDDMGRSYTVQTIKCDARYLQLWAMENQNRRWSSIRNNQQETAVLYSDYYILKGAESTAKSFYDRTNGISKPWNLAFIEEKVTLQHNGTPDITLWNRDGYLQFAPRLYSNVLKYQAGKVQYLYNEDPEVFPEPETEEWYPILFCKEDIKVYHFKTRNTINVMYDESDIQRIDFKPYEAADNDLYEEWTETHQPPFGRIKLRLTIKDDDKVYIVLYLPSMISYGKDVPVVRDFTTNHLHYVGVNGQVIDEPVQIPQDGTPLPPTRPILVWENEKEQVVLNVIQPTLIKEVYLDGKIIKYLQDGEEFTLPYLLRNRICIHDFNRDGYFEFQCLNIGKLKEAGSIDRWLSGETLCTYTLSSEIPSYLKVRFGNKESEGKLEQMLYWEYKDDMVPRFVSTNYIKEMSNYSILFQDMREVRPDLLCLPPKTNNNQAMGMGNFGDWGAFMSQTASPPHKDEKPLLCYDIAVKYQTYFFIFNPLFNLTEDKFLSDVCRPLRKRSNGELSEEELIHIIQCATELGFDWERLQYKI